MASVDFVILPFISCLWTTLGSSAASSSESPLHEEEWPSEDQMGSTTTIVASTAPPSTPENYLNRLDFISVIVICAIVAFCFGICVIIGCRRKKRRPSQLDFTDSQPPSVTTVEPRIQPARTTNVARNPSDLRVPESPPPTYSIIERQTSFTSYISQSSSHYEIPPGYEEAVSFGDSTNGEPYAHRPSRPGSRASSSRFFPISFGAQPKRSESAHTRGPPRSRTYRSSSDVGRARRARLSSRPATVSEDDTSSLTTSALTNPSTVLDMSAADATQAISIVADVLPTSQSNILNSACYADLAESVQPLLPSATSDTDDTISATSSQKKAGLVTRKLTLV